MSDVNTNNQVTGAGAASGTTGTSQTSEPNVITGEGEVTTVTSSGDSVTITSGDTTTTTTPAPINRNWGASLNITGADLLMVDLWQDQNEFVDFCINMPTYEEKQAMIAKYNKEYAQYKKDLKLSQKNGTTPPDPPVNKWKEITSSPQYARWQAGDVYDLPSGYGCFSGTWGSVTTTAAERNKFEHDLAREQMIVGCCRKLMDLMALFVEHEEARQGIIDTMISMMFGRKITSHKEVLDAIGEGMGELLNTLSKRLFEVISSEMERLADLKQDAMDSCAAYWDDEKNWYDSFTGADPEGEKLKEQAEICREYEQDLQALEKIIFAVAKALLPDSDLGLAIERFLNEKDKWIKKADGDYMDTDKKFILMAQKAIMDIQQAQETKEAFEDAKQGLIDTIMQVQFGLDKTGRRGQSIRRKLRQAVEQFAVQMMHQCVNITTQRIKAHNDAVQKEEEYNYHRANNRAIGGLSMKAWKSGLGMLVSPVLGLVLCIYGNTLDDTVHNRPVEEITKQDLYEIWGDRSALITEYIDALIKLLNNNDYIEEIEMDGTDETMQKIDYKEFEKAADEVYDINKREMFELAILTALQDLIDTIMQVNWQISADKSAINLQFANVNRRMVMTQACVGTIRTIMEDKVAEHNRMAMHNINEMLANIGIGSEVLKVVGTVLSVVGACLICTPAAAVGAALIIVGVVCNVVAAVIDKIITSIKESQAEALEESSRDGNEDLVDPSNPDADIINGMTYNNTTKWEEGDDVPIVGTIEYRNMDSAAVQVFADALTSRLQSLSFAMAVENAKADLVDTIISLNFDIQTSGNSLNKRLRQMKLSARTQRTIELFNTRFQQIMNQLEAVNKLVMAQTEDKMAGYNLAFSIVGAALKAIPYVGAALSVASEAVMEVINIAMQLVVTAVQLLLEILLEEAKKRNEEQLKEIMDQVKKQLDEALKSQEGKKDPVSEMVKQIIKDIIEHGLTNAGDSSVVNTVAFAKARQNLKKIMKLMEFQAKVEAAKASLKTAIMQNIDGRLSATDIISMQINMRQSLVRNFVNTMIQSIRHNQQQIADIKAANKAAEKAIIMKAVMGAINIVAQSISLAGAVKNVKLEARADAAGLNASALKGQEHQSALNSVKNSSDIKFDANMLRATISMKIIQLLTPVIMEILFHEAEKSQQKSDAEIDKQLDTKQGKKADQKSLERKAKILKAQVKAMRHQSSDQLFQSLFMKMVNSIGTVIQLGKKGGDFDNLSKLQDTVKALEKYGDGKNLSAQEKADMEALKQKAAALTTSLKSQGTEQQRAELKMMLDASSTLAQTQTIADQVIMNLFNDQARVEKGLAQIEAKMADNPDPTQKAALTNQLATLTQQKQEIKTVLDNLATITKGETAEDASRIQSQLAATLGKVAMSNTTSSTITSINDLVTSQSANATDAAISTSQTTANLSQTMTTLMNNCETQQAKQNLAQSVISNQNLTTEQKTTVLSAMSKSDTTNATAVSKALVTEVKTSGQKTETANLMGKMFEKSPDVVANAVSQLDSKQQTQLSTTLQTAIDKTPQQGAMQSNMIEMQQLVNAMVTDTPTEANVMTVAKSSPVKAAEMAETIIAKQPTDAAKQAMRAQITEKLTTALTTQTNASQKMNIATSIALINPQAAAENTEIMSLAQTAVTAESKPEQLQLQTTLATMSNPNSDPKITAIKQAAIKALTGSEKPQEIKTTEQIATAVLNNTNISANQKAAILTTIATSAIAKSDAAIGEAVSTALTSQVTNSGKQTEISNIMGKIYEKAPDVVANAMTQMSTEQKASLDSTFTDMIKSPSQQGPMQSNIIEMQLLLNASSQKTTDQALTTLTTIAEKNPDQAVKIANILINQQTTQEAKQAMQSQIATKLEEMITPREGKPIKDSAKNMNVITTLAKVSPETVKNNQNIKTLVNTALKQDASAEQIKMLATIATSQCGETSTIAATSLANSAGISLDTNNMTKDVARAIIRMENNNMTQEQKTSLLTSIASTDKATAEIVSDTVLNSSNRDLSDAQKASILTAIAKTDSTNAEAVSTVLTTNLTNEATQQQTSFVMGKMVEDAPDVFANITQNIETDKQANITAAFDNLNILTQQQGAMQSNMIEMKQLVDAMMNAKNDPTEINSIISNIAKTNPTQAASIAESVISQQKSPEAKQELRTKITENLTTIMSKEADANQKTNIATTIALINPKAAAENADIVSLAQTSITDTSTTEQLQLQATLATVANPSNDPQIAIIKQAATKAITGSEAAQTTEQTAESVLSSSLTTDQKATILTAMANSNTANAEAVSKTLVTQASQAGTNQDTAIHVMGKIHEKSPEVAAKMMTQMTDTQKTNFSTSLQTTISTTPEGPVHSNLIEMQQLLNNSNSDVLLNKLTNQIVSTQNSATSEIMNKFTSQCATNISSNPQEQSMFMQQVQNSMIKRAVETNPTDPAQMALLDNFVSNAKQSSDPQMKELGLQMEKIAESKKEIAVYCKAIQNAEDPKVKVAAILNNDDISPEQKAQIIRFGSGGDVATNKQIQSATQEYISNMSINENNVETLMHLSSSNGFGVHKAAISKLNNVIEQQPDMVKTIINNKNQHITSLQSEVNGLTSNSEIKPLENKQQELFLKLMQTEDEGQKTEINKELEQISGQINDLKLKGELKAGASATILMEQENQDALLTAISHVSEKNMTTVCLGLSAKDAATIVFKTPDRNLLGEWIYGDKKDVAEDIIKQHAQNGDTQKAKDFATTLQAAVKNTVDNYKQSLADADDSNTKAAYHKQLNILSDMEAVIDKATNQYLSGDSAVNPTADTSVKTSEVLTQLNTVQSFTEKASIIETSVLNNKNLSDTQKANIMLSISKSDPANAKAVAWSLKQNLANTNTQEQTAFVMGKMYEKAPEVVAGAVNQLDSDSIKDINSSLSRVSTREMKQQGPIHDTTTIEMKQLIKAMASSNAEDLTEAVVKIGENNPQSATLVMDIVTNDLNDTVKDKIEADVISKLKESTKPKENTITTENINGTIEPTSENINSITTLATLDPSYLLGTDGEIKPEIKGLIDTPITAETKTEQTQLLATLANHPNEKVSTPAKEALAKLSTEDIKATITEVYTNSPQKGCSILTSIATADPTKAGGVISEISNTNPDFAKELTIGMCNALNQADNTKPIIGQTINHISDKTMLEQISDSPDLPDTAKESIKSTITIKENGVVFSEAIGTKGATDSIITALTGKNDTEKETIIKSVIDSQELSLQQKAAILSGVAKNDPANAPAISKALTEMATTEATKVQSAFIMGKMYEEAPEIVSIIALEMNNEETKPNTIIEGIDINQIKQQGPLNDETIAEMKLLLKTISSDSPGDIASNFALLTKTNPEQAKTLLDSIEGHPKTEEIKEQIIQSLTSSLEMKGNNIELSKENLNTVNMMLTIDPGSMIIDGSTTNEIKPEFIKLLGEPISTELKTEQTEMLCMASCNPALSKEAAPQLIEAYNRDPQLVSNKLTQTAQNNPKDVAGAIKQINLVNQTAAQEISINILNSLHGKEGQRVSLNNFIEEMKAQNSDLTEQIQKPSPRTDIKPTVLNPEVATLIDDVDLDQPITLDGVTLIEAGKTNITIATAKIKAAMDAEGADKNRIINSILNNDELSAEDKASIFAVIAKDPGDALVIATALSNRLEQTGKQFETAHIMGEMYDKAPDVFAQAISEMNKTSTATTKAFLQKVADIDMDTKQQGRVYDGSAIEMQHLLKSILLQDEMEIIEHYLDVTEKYELQTVPSQNGSQQIAPQEASDMLYAINKILSSWSSDTTTILTPSSPAVEEHTPIRTGSDVTFVPDENTEVVADEEVKATETLEQIETTEGFQTRFIQGAIGSPEERVSKFRSVALRAPEKAGLILTELDSQITSIQSDKDKLGELKNLRGTQGAPGNLETQITQLDEQIKENEEKLETLQSMKEEFFAEIKRNSQVLSAMLEKGNFSQREKAEIITEITSQPEKFGYDVMTVAIKAAFTAPGTKLSGLDKDFSFKVMEYVLDNTNHDNYTQTNELMNAIVTNERKTRVKQFMEMAIQKDKVDFISNKNISITLIRAGFPADLITSLKPKLSQSDRGSIYDRLKSKEGQGVTESNLNNLQASWGVVIDDSSAKRLADLSFMLLNEHTEEVAA